jgi:hypothetical protein
MPAKILEAARAMAWHLWPALAAEDTLVVPQLPPDGFPEYLSGLDVTPPHFLPIRDPAAPASRLPDFLRFTPFGWNDEAVRLNAQGAHPSAHPDQAVVRRVNSRAFGLELERELFGEEACPAVFCASADAVNEWMASAPTGRYVAKGNHGHAGIGQLRFSLPAPSPDEAARLAVTLKRLAARHGGVVFEQEQQVGREWGLLFRIGRDGSLSEFRVHRLLSGSAGGYAGALVTPDPDPDWNRHRARAEDGARRIAAALHRAGYFGPAGIDLYAHGDGSGGADGARLRPLVDLNARMSMAYPAHGLAARFPGRAVLLRQIPAGALRIPGEYKDLRLSWDKLSFNSALRRGAIWLTPLLPLPRHSLAFVGDHEADVLSLQREVLKP